MRVYQTKLSMMQILIPVVNIQSEIQNIYCKLYVAPFLNMNNIKHYKKQTHIYCNEDLSGEWFPYQLHSNMGKSEGKSNNNSC